MWARGGRLAAGWSVAVTATLLVSAPVAVAAQSAGAGRGPSELAAEVEARELAFAGTMADRDLDAFLSFVSPEAVFFAGDRALRGREAVAEAWSGFFEGEDAPFSWRPDVVEVLESGRLALTSGPVFGPDGERVGRFNSIWRKDDDGQWRVVFDRGS